MTSRTAYTALIKHTATTHDLDADLVEAVVLVESNGQTDAFRFEPKFYERYHLAAHPIYGKLGARRSSSSYGLMQLLYPTACEIGYNLHDPEYLFVPEIGLTWGCRQLARLVTWADGFAVPDATRILAILAAYNGGRGGNRPDQPLRPNNLKYAQRVLALARTLQPR